jgi:hypothetical protein
MTLTSVLPRFLNVSISPNEKLLAKKLNRIVEEENIMSKPKKVVKKLIRVSGHPWEKSNPYKCNSLGFAFLNKTGDERRQCNKIIFCRDYFLNVICYNKTDGRHTFNATDYMDRDEHPHMDFDALRLLLFRDPADVDEFKAKLFSAKRALNYYEELAGFGSRSTITTVKHAYKENAWLLTGPSEWLMFPTFISMAALVLRIVSKYGPVADGSTPDDLMMELREANARGTDKEEWGKISGDSDISSYLTNSADKFGFMMRNWREIFGKAEGNEDKIWCDGGNHSFYTLAGFVNMCSWAEKGRESSDISVKYYKKIIDRFHDLWQNHKKEIKTKA